MANYNLAKGGDPHYNENYALYPQNAFIESRPEFGESKTVLKPAHHWEGGHYAEVRHMNFNDEQHQCALMKVAQNLKVGDTFLSHIVPGGSLLTDFSYVIHTPLEGASFTIKLASDGTVLGTVNGATKEEAWLKVGVNEPQTNTATVTHPSDGSTETITMTFTDFNQGIYVPYDRNDAIEWVIDAWPDREVEQADEDPCGVYGPCTEPVNFCFTSTTFYKNPRAEVWCPENCWV